jgi:hypothetical protein
VLDSWVDGPQAFCVVYTCERYRGRLGLRREAGDIANGLLYDGHDGGAGLPNPLAFGRNVADYDLAEPLGGAAESLTRDESGISWWGTV